MERDGFACCVCHSTHDTLNVHHLFYMRARVPWDYPDWVLVTLCEFCHSQEHVEERTGFERGLTNVLKLIGGKDKFGALFDSIEAWRAGKISDAKMLEVLKGDPRQ